MRARGGRPWAAREAGAKAAAAMSWASVRRLNIGSPKCQDRTLSWQYRETPPQTRPRIAAHARGGSNRLRRRCPAALSRAGDGGFGEVAAGRAPRSLVAQAASLGCGRCLRCPLDAGLADQARRRLVRLPASVLSFGAQYCHWQDAGDRARRQALSRAASDACHDAVVRARRDVAVHLARSALRLRAGIAGVAEGEGAGATDAGLDGGLGFRRLV